MSCTSLPPVPIPLGCLTPNLVQLLSFPQLPARSWGRLTGWNGWRCNPSPGNNSAVTRSLSSVKLWWPGGSTCGCGGKPPLQALHVWNAKCGESWPREVLLGMVPQPCCHENCTVLSSPQMVTTGQFSKIRQIHDFTLSCPFPNPKITPVGNSHHP